MLEIKGDFWQIAEKYDAICVTTNGIIKKDGSLVMGAGIAKDFSIKFPSLPKLLGKSVTKYGNNCYLSQASYNEQPIKILSFPTKKHWKDPSDLDLIVRSAKQATLTADKFELRSLLLTRPGCGNGGLNWSDVKQAISFLDDRFTVIEKQ